MSEVFQNFSLFDLMASHSQCAGLVGVIVSSITPQVGDNILMGNFIKKCYQTSVPLLLKKIAEDLDYLKESIDIVRYGLNSFGRNLFLNSAKKV